MQFDFTKIENEFDFKNNIARPETTDFKSIIVNSFKKTSFFITSVSAISLFLLANKISFTEQIDFIEQSNFNNSLLAFYSLFFIFKIIQDNFFTSYFSKNSETSFVSLWVPIKFAFFSSFLIPINSNHTSILSQTLIELIKNLDKLF